MKQREDTIRKWFSLWLDSREAELSDLFTEDAAYIESWGPEYLSLIHISEPTRRS